MYDILVCKLILWSPHTTYNKYTIKNFYIKIYTDSSVRICWGSIDDFNWIKSFQFYFLLIQALARCVVYLKIPAVDTGNKFKAS